MILAPHEHTMPITDRLMLDEHLRHDHGSTGLFTQDEFNPATFEQLEFTHAMAHEATR